VSYYWSAEESEWASDVMFGDACQLAAIYPGLIRHGMTAFGGKSVLPILFGCGRSPRQVLCVEPRAKNIDPPGRLH
jgi:hypothetical protein